MLYILDKGYTIWYKSPMFKIRYILPRALKFLDKIAKTGNIDKIFVWLILSLLQIIQTILNRKDIKKYIEIYPTEIDEHFLAMLSLLTSKIHREYHFPKIVTGQFHGGKEKTSWR